ncbi:STAS domain-containing protein [Streptomyces parvulus]|uniref:STAS domain-containing protein n=1 Tax=Streptomyces parvulus TaxID=146923 RepID=UPI0033B95C18
MEITDGAQEGFVVSGRWQDDVLEVAAEDMTVSGRGVLRMLHVAGEVDIDTAPVLRDGLNQAAADRPHTVVVDLSGLAFGGSSTLNTLIEARRRLPALVIAGPLTPMVQRPFTLSGLDGFFTTAPDTETAIRQLTAP